MAVKKRVVVVGVGSIGLRHARLLCKRHDVEVELLDSHESVAMKASKELGNIPIHSSFEIMLQSNPDIVFIATPTSMHSDQAILALEAGSHVFCEKPMCDSVTDAEKIKKAADKAKKIFNVGFHLHFHPGLLKLKKLLAHGILGTILNVHAKVGTYITLVNSKSRHQQEKEGALVWDYAHQPDILYWLLDKIPTSVYAAGIQAGKLELSSNPNLINTIYRYDDSLIASVHLNYVQMPERHEYEIIGDKGWAILNVNEGTLTTGCLESNKSIDESFSTDRDTIYSSQYDAFLQAVNNTNRSPETSAEDGMVSIKLCEATLTSWRTGNPVNIG